MGKSSEQFLQLRAEEMANMYSHDFTKKEAKETGIKMVSDLLENGEVDKLQFMANLCRLKEVVNSADEEMRKHLPDEKTKVFGVEFTPTNGGETLNYKDCEIYTELQSKLKAREELLKLAYKSKDEIYDSEGILVPKVSSTTRKSPISIKF